MHSSFPSPLKKWHLFFVEPQGRGEEGTWLLYWCHRRSPSEDLHGLGDGGRWEVSQSGDEKAKERVLERAARASVAVPKAQQQTEQRSERGSSSSGEAKGFIQVCQEGSAEVQR